MPSGQPSIKTNSTICPAFKKMLTVCPHCDDPALGGLGVSNTRASLLVCGSGVCRISTARITRIGAVEVAVARGTTRESACRLSPWRDEDAS